MLEIFQYDFMQRALVAGIIIAIIAPMIGVFLVMRRYSFLADTLAHVSLAGIALGVLLNASTVLTAMLTSVLTSIAVEELRMRKKVLGESSLVLFLSGGLALSAILFGLSSGTNISLSAVLFGSITTVSQTDLYIITGIGIVVMAFILLFYRTLFAVALDEELALSIGLPVVTINRVFIVLAAVTVSVSLTIVGVLLVSALMVIPAITATQFKVSFKKTLILAVCVSLFSVLSGLALSFYGLPLYAFGTVNVPSGGAIVMVAIVLFGLSLAWNTLQKSR